MKNYTVEFRVDVQADTPEQAIETARKIVEKDGRVTAVFDDDWNEVT